MGERKAMKAWKLFRVRKDGTLGTLFVGRGEIIPFNVWLSARFDLPHKGLAYRPGWHCCSSPVAPHLKLMLKSGEKRVWCHVEIEDFKKHQRPDCQGGLWFTANRLKVVEVLNKGNT